MKPIHLITSTLLATALALPVHGEEKKSIVIKIDGKDLSIPEAAQAGVDKAMEALHAALASKEIANINVDEIRETIRKAIDDAGVHGTMIHRNFASDAAEKGNPYSAREVREFKQTLGDGTVISRQSTRLLARDRDGRTRQELRQPDGSARVFINDPVEKVAFILDPQKRVACRADFNERAINDCFNQTRGDWKPLGFAFSASKNGIGMMNARDDLTVEVSPRAQIIDLSKKTIIKHDFSGPLLPTPPLPPIPPTPTLSGTPGANATQITREKKTQQPYEGLSVDVDRTVETIAVGSIGNSKAIESVYERYYSPELKTNVYVRRSDPRNGESVYRMVDVKRTAPDAQLFRAPGGYTVSEGKK
jgi:hypothetical protein